MFRKSLFARVMPRVTGRHLSNLTPEERLKFISTPPYTLPDHKKISSPPMVSELERYPKKSYD
jgi:hypothetical protein